MKVLMLSDALGYMERLLIRFQKSGKASSEDLTMQRYIIDIIESRIQEKELEK